MGGPPVAGEPRPAAGAAKAEVGDFATRRARSLLPGWATFARARPQRHRDDGGAGRASDATGRTKIINRTRPGLPSSRVWQTRRRAAAPRPRKRTHQAAAA